MPNTYSQIYIHIVFAVKGKENIIRSDFREELHKYTTGIVTNKNQKLIAIFCMSDHVHLLIGLKPDMSISEIVRDIKANSSRFINSKKWIKGKFQWQEGFGAFSVSQSQMDKVYNYILNQEKHHSSKSFKEEYIELLKKYEVAYKEEYLFEWLEDMPLLRS
ncbi:MAG: IS200/IS605 family transposase [Bacteroidia bacterium]|nr:IS200/IS605 family transposase [Bacteroidia bacterium]